LTQALETIEARTLAELKRKDPWLQLTWQDFLDLCETHCVGFYETTLQVQAVRASDLLKRRYAECL